MTFLYRKIQASQDTVCESALQYTEERNAYSESSFLLFLVCNTQNKVLRLCPAESAQYPA